VFPIAVLCDGELLHLSGEEGYKSPKKGKTITISAVHNGNYFPKLYNHAEAGNTSE